MMLGLEGRDVVQGVIPGFLPGSAGGHGHQPTVRMRKLAGTAPLPRGKRRGMLRSVAPLRDARTPLAAVSQEKE